jgi:HSP20 family protein
MAQENQNPAESGQQNLARREGGSGRTELARPQQQSYSGPFTIARRMMEEMDRIFEDIGGFGLGTRGQQRGLFGSMMPFGAREFIPNIEVFERDGNLVVRADLPGVKQEDLKIELVDDQLILSGERKSEHEENRPGVYRSERVYGMFQRVIQLPDGVDPDGVTASFNDGVLEIVVKVPEQAQKRSKQINISGGQTPTTRH